MRGAGTLSLSLICALFILLLAKPVYSDISDQDLENIYNDVIDNVKSEKLGYEGLDTTELEDFRNNPLDLNSVTRPDLLKLPLLTPRLVIAIIRYRVHHKGFREVEELKDVPGITNEIYRVIRPFLTVYTEAEKESTRGELRLTQRLELPFSDKQIESPENFHHPEYLMSRLRFFYGDSVEVSFTAKRDAWGKEISWENFRKYYLVSNYFYAKNFSKFNTVVIGAYKLDFERGLVLGSVAKTIPSVGKDKKGVEPYRASSRNAGFYGIALQKNTPDYTYALFWSDKYLTTKLNPDGTAKSVPSSVNFSYSGEANFGNVNDLEDYFYGFYFTFPLKGYNIHFAGYREKFNPEIVPVERNESYWDEAEATAWENQTVKYIKYKFSGGKNDVFGGGVKTAYGNGRFFFDWALSKHNAYESNVDRTKETELAKALQFSSLYNFSYTSILFGISRFDADYYNFHISGDKPIERMFSEVRAKSKGLNMKWGGEIWREVKPIAAITTKNYYKTYVQIEYPFFRKFKTMFRYQIENSDMKMKFYYTGDYTQVLKTSNRSRVRLTWQPTSDFRIRWQYETQEAIQDENNIWLYSTTQTEMKYRFSRSFQILSRLKYSKDPGTKRNKYVSFSLNPKMRFSKNSQVTMKYEWKAYNHPPEFYDVNYGDIDYTNSAYTYDGEKILSENNYKFEVKYVFKF